MKRSDVDGLDEFLEDVKAEDVLPFLEKIKELQCQVNDFVDDVENRVNEALDFLKDITSIIDLDNVNECYDVLEKLSKDLY